MAETIILIEDDQDFAGSLAASINDALDSARVVAVGDPRRAIELIDQLAPVLLIADVHLGATNVLTLLNELASYPDTLKLPKIVLSSSGRDLSMDDLRQYGVSAVYDKRTYQLPDLIVKIKELLPHGC